MTRLILPAVILILSLQPAYAQQPGTLSEQDMKKVREMARNMPPVDQKTIDAAMGMNKCMMESLGKEGMAKIEQQGKAAAEQVRALCAAGRKEEAVQAQIRHGEEMMRSLEYAKLKLCSERFKDVLKDPAMAPMQAKIETLMAEKKADPCGTVTQ